MQISTIRLESAPYRTPGQQCQAMPALPRPARTWRSWRAAIIGGCLITLLGLAVSVPAAPAAQKAYVGLFKDNAIAVLDMSTNRVLSTIPVPAGPHGLVITPDGRKVYVSSDGASTVSVIDTASDRVVRSIEVGPTPHGLAIAPDGHRVLVSGFGANQVVSIDTASDQVTGRVPVPQPHNSAISPDGRTAYVGSQQQGATALVILDLDKKMQIGTVPLEKTPRALNFSPDGRWLYVTVAGVDAVQVFDPVTRQVVSQIPVGASPHVALFTPDGHTALVVSQGPGEVGFLEPSRSAASGTVAVGKAPHWLAISTDAHTAYVTNEGSNDVSVVDLVSQRVTGTIPVGNAPRKIALQPGPGSTASGAPAAPASATQATPSQARALTLGHLTFSDHGLQEVADYAELELEADDYYFAPTFLRGQPGQKIKLEIENESATLHNLSIPAQGLDKDIPPKGKVELAITFPSTGVVHFFCKFHSALGMNGELLTGNVQPQPVAQDSSTRTK